ncbi:hypothetical protein [Paenibacillus sp. YYML68]|uniref:hypothetical protein n=1 Tax=Paenibacillus sp. YYML68 TaxID=2909250 RepID=UPI00248FE412|nr:hypothetical protein [Paenibacillus sp. YYML68]
MTAQTCQGLSESYCDSLVGIELDDTQTQMLLSITREHCKLALEHSQANTIQEQRREISDEIQSLLLFLDNLVLEWRRQ